MTPMEVRYLSSLCGPHKVEHINRRGEKRLVYSIIHLESGLIRMELERGSSTIPDDQVSLTEFTVTKVMQVVVLDDYDGRRPKTIRAGTIMRGLGIWIVAFACCMFIPGLPVWMRALPSSFAAAFLVFLLFIIIFQPPKLISYLFGISKEQS